MVLLPDHAIILARHLVDTVVATQQRSFEPYSKRRVPSF